MKVNPARMHPVSHQQTSCPLGHQFLSRAVGPMALVITAALAGSVAGCYSPEFAPKSTASSEMLRNAKYVQPRSADETSAEPAPLHPADKVLAEANTGESYIRLDAPPTPGPNAFGEFGNEGERPYIPVTGRGGYQQHSFVDEGFDTDVSLSPDGRWMVFASTRHSMRSDIYLQRTTGLAVTKLTTDPADDAFPTFSPDGSRIAFSSNRAGSWDIYVMDANGRNVMPVTQGPGHDLHPSFSPDGRRLVYSRFGGRSQQWELWTADLDTGEQTMVGFGLFPDWSPRTDRDVIAFQRARQRGGRWFSLWTMALDHGEPTNVTEVAMSTNAALIAPTWSPDGAKLAFATVVDPDAGLPDIDAEIGRQDIWTINADGSDRHRLTDGKGTYATPVWATDGRVYFISNRGGTECIWSTRADGPNFSTAAIDVKPTPSRPTPPATATIDLSPADE